MVKLYHDKLDTALAIANVADAQCGGLSVFIGTVRNATEGRNVQLLEFEAYENMAIKEMEKIRQQAITQFGVHNVAIFHRLGRVPIGEAAVVIAASSPHRDAAFKACRFAIDTLKETVPIWKKEIFEDGEVWVSAHP